MVIPLPQLRGVGGGGPKILWGAEWTENYWLAKMFNDNMKTINFIFKIYNDKIEKYRTHSSSGGVESVLYSVPRYPKFTFCLIALYL